jgi:hypothetical protein
MNFVDGKLVLILESSNCTRWQQVVSFIPQMVYCWEKSSSAHRMGDWVGPKAILDTLEKRKYPAYARN